MIAQWLWLGDRAVDSSLQTAAWRLTAGNELLVFLSWGPGVQVPRRNMRSSVHTDHGVVSAHACAF